jgi:hypothetical protein
MHDSLRNRISPFQKKRNNKQADSQTDRERERERERLLLLLLLLFLLLFLGKKRLVEGTMKSLAPERGNHF